MIKIILKSHNNFIFFVPQSLHANLARAEQMEFDATARNEAELKHKLDELETERKHSRVRQLWISNKIQVIF